MTEKFWKRSDDWFQYAPCFGIRDFTVPPAREDGGPVADVPAIKLICGSCRVRPECARTAYLEQWSGVWACGVWIPGHDEDKRKAQERRDGLMGSVPEELERRGDDV